MEIVCKYEYLEKIVDEILLYEEYLSIGLLIGNNCVCVLKLRFIVFGRLNDFYVICIMLGWGVVGVRNYGDYDSEIEVIVGCYCIVIWEILSEEVLIGKFVFLKSCKEVMVLLVIKKMFE